ncbi:GPW/gp25 family protein [Vibrio sp. S4M6]|uniref:GPW/gp25 family protein n=1 Tax=Vibrio sinus TaxID=2946865 RepID=UPI00202A6DD4|nr:GPW/gp25 family protein [Vibrio sinus]MCL9783153.1 GPW/gp25 family protein [Vibrio sinus]
MSFYNTFLSDNKLGQDPREIDDIRYNLTRLFESEASLIDFDDRLTQINRSNFRFGIEDSQLLSASIEPTQLAVRLSTLISAFEPRLSNVTVELTERKQGENSISFNILATVVSEFGENELVFESKIALNDLAATLEEDSYD